MVTVSFILEGGGGGGGVATWLEAHFKSHTTVSGARFRVFLIGFNLM